MLKLRRKDRTSSMERVKMFLKVNMRNRKEFTLKLVKIFVKGLETQLKMDNMYV